MSNSRRAFLGTSAATAALWAGGKLYAADAPAKSGPSETINLGVVGCGARAKQVLSNFLKLPGVRVTAVCDVHSAHLDECHKLWGGAHTTKYQDFRKLIEDKAVDAVVMATNAHWHILPTIYACHAGKDVYLEKPMGNFIGEGRYAIEAAKKYNRIVQIGTQQRSRQHYRDACELIQAGKIGAVSEVKVWDFENWWPGRGNPPNCPPPKEIDWEMYCGPAPLQEYNPNCYYNYGYDWFRFSGGGHQVAWGVHHFDIVHWAMGVQHPIAVSAMGGKYAFPDDNRQWPDTLVGIVEYGPGPVAKHGFVMQYTMRIGCRREQRSHGKCFFGTDASLQIDRSRYTIRPETAKGKKKVSEEELEVLAAEDEARHQAVFLENLRNRTKPFANLETGHTSTNPGHLLNVAWQVGRRLQWDGEKEQVVGDPEANALVHRSYRAPWKLEVI